MHRILMLGFLILAGCPGSETREVQDVSAGIRYIRIHKPSGPMVIHVLELDRSQPTWAMHSLKVAGLLKRTQTLTEIVREQTGYIAAMNGDFFSQEGYPSGLQFSGGWVVKESPDNWNAMMATDRNDLAIGSWQTAMAIGVGKEWQRLDGINRNRLENETIVYNRFFGPTTGTNAFGIEIVVQITKKPKTFSDTIVGRVVYVDSSHGDQPLSDTTLVLSAHGNGTALFKNFRPGATVRLTGMLDPKLPGVAEAIGGYPILVKNGKNLVDGAWLNKDFARSANARSAVGFSDQKLFLVCVDGNQPNYSAGMNLVELADLMTGLGCESALNLDGGGSATMIVQGKRVNRPSDGGLERPIANALAIRVKAP